MNTEQDDVQIKNMQPEDVDSVVWVEQSASRMPWSRKLFEDELKQHGLAHYFVARCQGHIIGYMGFWLVQDEAHITNLAVHPAFQRKGIATQLLVASLEAARRLGASRATLEVRAGNVAAQRLYTKHGFRLAAVRRAYYADNQEDALIMWRNEGGS